MKFGFHRTRTGDTEVSQVRTGEQEFFLLFVLLLGLVPGFGGPVRLQKRLALAPVRQVLGVHAGEVDGRVQQTHRGQLAGDAQRVLRARDIADGNGKRFKRLKNVYMYTSNARATR